MTRKQRDSLRALASLAGRPRPESALRAALAWISALPPDPPHETRGRKPLSVDPATLKRALAGRTLREAAVVLGIGETALRRLRSESGQ